ncbi:lactate racemase domain-containing protein [Metallumcola ferriviriculae]|uniref:Lactate racemase domain-containing protein n=1 Tax=Metallumcola ferriviriculae TaxID=3039180 RepID=A0AAU0UMI5_9FIRM|nr:lactate racemase domain-containing protein [Desulfitibacteraceae bacterium MK1]
MQSFPEFYKIRQVFDDQKEENLDRAMKRAFSEAGIDQRIKPGQSIAITAGSRGITDIPRLLALVGQEVRALGGEPFLVAAMGSHGGGTAEGMLEVLHSLGITEDTVKMPLAVSSETIQLDETSKGLPVFCAVEAKKADGVIVVNRVKAHTAFRGDHESGLLKMLAVGLGRAAGAAVVHRHGPARMAQTVVEMGNATLQCLPVIGGIGIIENGAEETALLAGAAPADFQRVDRELLQKAKKMMSRLPVDNLDLLVVEEMGKNYSGTGMDTNVIGRFYLEGVAEPKLPEIRRIAVLGLSAASHGNANGVGLADIITRKLYNAIDFPATYKNGLTTNFLERIKIPVVMPDDERALLQAWASLGLDAPECARVVMIHDTLNLHEMYLSPALKEEIKDLEHITVTGKYTLSFNRGRLRFVQS